MFILPCLSTSHSTAPEKKKRVKALASFLVSGSFFSFSSNNFHSSIGYANRHLSSPRVTTKLSPSSSRNLAGTIILPFVSMLCWNSPMNIQFAPLSYFYITTSPHNSPPPFPKRYIHCLFYIYTHEKNCPSNDGQLNFKKRMRQWLHPLFIL